MRLNQTFALIMYSTLLAVSGCGFGGFNGPGNTPGASSPNPAEGQLVSGVAAKGFFRNGNVRFYLMKSDGTGGALLKTSTTDAFGNYSARLSLNGALLVKASGTYVDEATGGDLTVDDGAPLRAATAELSSLMSLAVTPLTELAVRYAEARASGGNPLTAGFDMAAANALLSDIFKVNVTGAHPIELSRTAFGNANAAQANKDYAFALAAVSQAVHDNYGGALTDLLANWSVDISGSGTLSSANAALFKTALTAFLNSERNQTGLRDINQTNLGNAGGGVKVFKLATFGTLAAGQAIGGIVLTLQLPSNVSVRADLSAPPYRPLSGVVTASGVVPPGTNSDARYTPATATAPATLTIGLVHQTGFPLGEFVTVKCDIPAGATVQASDFVLTSFEAVDGDGGIPLSSVTAEAQ